MGEILKAHVQTKDWVGDSALDFDMINGLDIKKISNIPEGFFPIGASIYFGENGYSNITIIACDESKYGSNMEELMRHKKNKC